ncbi:MAG TPA: monovalent cation/H+ antiporter complex subunit F [Phototrophicaceae bacterium]|jgi:multicomponent Na+:H+ antiporter subunit F|nr:monovalent cation/H+ antiporter complex subunit F [Phototrophicaceae bacterium]
MSPFLLMNLQAVLIILVLLMLPCAYRVIVGPSAADRLQAIDAITTLLIGIIVVLAVLQRESMFVDISIALAALGFIGTLVLARYIAERKVF